MRWLRSRDSLETRIARFLADIDTWIDAVWPEARWALAFRGQERQLKSALERLESRWSAAELPSLAADVFFHPVLWFARDPGRSGRIQHLLGVFLAIRPPEDIAARTEARILHMFCHPCDGETPGTRQTMYTSSPHHFYTPTLGTCLELLVRLPPTPAVLELTARLVRGEYNADPVPAPCFMRSQNHPDLVMIASGSLPLPGYDRPGAAYPYEFWRHELSRNFPELMERLFDHGMLPFETFQTAVKHLPMVLTDASRGYRPINPAYPASHDVGAAFADTVQSYCDRITREAYVQLDESSIAILSQVTEYRGPECLLQAVRLHAQSGLGKLVFDGHMYRRDAGAVIVRLAQAAGTEPADEATRAAMVGELRTFPPETLKRLLPVAAPSRRLLLDALQWQEVWPLVEHILQIAGLDRPRSPWERMTRSSADPNEGVVDPVAIRDALARAGDERAKEVLRLFREAKVFADIAVTLVESVAGWNRRDIEERIRKRSQPAVRAYGLLPPLRGEDEVLERYLFFSKYAEESKKFGMLRQGNEKAAAQAGMENLARTAGYGDATRLEWAMEARLGESIAPGREWSIAGYDLKLTLAGGRAEVSTKKDGRTLKSIPAAAKERPEYAEVKEALKQFRGQASRFRVSLENVMAEGDALRCAEIERLLRLPAASGFVTSLIWMANGEICGLLDGKATTLIALNGSQSPLPERVTVAHPFHLFRAGVLGAWQREIVHRRIEQPFKQAFRELYVLTPAEQETRMFSNRFAGRLLHSGVASRLFQARGWKFEPGDAAVPYKVFPKHGLRAVFDFPDAGHILAETESVTSDRIHFERHPQTQGTWAPESAWVPLTEIPPVLFSEVMRDADLVVSVAQQGEVILSDEAFLRRGEVVQALLSDLDLPGVTIDEHYARVKGHLATYKVHLGTAHIFIEPGNYLCVVPAHWGTKHEKLFLPFVDEADSKFSEVISKILFLVNDDKIKDQSILMQIRRGGLGPVPLHA